MRVLSRSSYLQYERPGMKSEPKDALVPSEDEWFNLPAVLLFEMGTIRLREDATANISELLSRLINGTYSKPFVLDDGVFRRLHFSLGAVQSKMCIEAPYALKFAYIRKMMAFLLFVPQPKHLIIVGLGGGSLTKFCYRQLPRTRITTVEIDGDVIEFSKLFLVPSEDERLRIIHADAVDYMATTREAADAILIDGCDKYGVAPEFCQKYFYQSLRDRLVSNGVLVMNLFGPFRNVYVHLRHMAEVFTNWVIVRDVGSGGNHVVFAFKDPAYSPDWASIQRSAKQLKEEHRLDFPRFAARIQDGSNILGIEPFPEGLASSP